MNIFREMYYSVWNFDKYKEFLKNKKFKVFGVGFILAFLFFVCSTLIPIGGLVATNGGLGSVMDKYIPEFKLEDGTLWVDGTYTLNESGVLLDIDTDTSSKWMSADQPEMREYLRPYTSAILVDYEKLICKSNGQVQTIYFEDFGDTTLTKADLYEIIPYAYTFIIIVLVVLFFMDIFGFFVGALLLSLIGLALNNTTRAGLSFGQIFVLTIYTRTLPYILKILASFLPMGIPGLWIISIGITILYLSIILSKIGKARASQMQAQAPYGQAPQNPYGQAPQNPYGQAPQNPYGQAPQNPYGQAPQNPYSQQPQQPAQPQGGNLTPNDGWTFGSSDKHDGQ